MKSGVSNKIWSILISVLVALASVLSPALAASEEVFILGLGNGNGARYTDGFSGVNARRWLEGGIRYTF